MHKGPQKRIFKVLIKRILIKTKAEKLPALSSQKISVQREI